MRTLPRHLVLAAIVLTVCCAEGQVTLSAPELAQMAAEMSRNGRNGENRSWRHDERQVPAASRRPSSAGTTKPVHPQSIAVLPLVVSDRQVQHQSYPPSRFRLPPPMMMC